MPDHSSIETTGKVWIVGAGPGDKGLMTLKGRAALSKADAVIYDAAVGSGILSMIPSGAESICADAADTDATDLLIEKAKSGRNAVRLIEGDPFVFATGADELSRLAENGIIYEIVPGVTGAFAVPAYAGMHVTDTEIYSSVHVITGRRRKDNTYGIDFGALAEGGGTLIFVDGIRSIGVITNGLLSAGMDPDTPAAIVEKGTTAAQRIISSTLQNLKKDAEKSKASMPAVIITGDAASPAGRFGWRKSLPLAGMRVIIPGGSLSEPDLVRLLNERGAETVLLKVMQAVPAEAVRLQTAVRELRNDSYEWIVFTSADAVRMFMEAALEDLDIRVLSYCSVAALDHGAEIALLETRIKADFVTNTNDVRMPAAQLAARLRKRDRVLVIGDGSGADDIAAALSRVRGVAVDHVTAYRTEYMTPAWFDPGEAFREPHTFAVFTSVDNVRGFVNAYPDMKFRRIRAFCMGHETADAARFAGMNVCASERPTTESLMSLIGQVKY